MKNFNFYLAISGLITLSLFSCKKKDDKISSTGDLPPVYGSYVKSKNLTGTLKGTLKQDSTYYLVGNVVVNPTDTFGVQPGATIIATGNFNLFIRGTFICIGTDAKQITWTTNNPNKLTNLGLNGYWGGFLVDSTSKYVCVKYTHINYTGGPDLEGSAQASFDVEGSQSYNIGAHIIFENNWMFGGIDDGLHFAGAITVSVKRNILQRLGGPDGETMNIKKGVGGDIAYNYIWSAANNSIKLETGSILSPQTKMNIFNNTLINGGWRKVGEATQGILIDKFAAAYIYNNVLVGCRNGINITNKADTNHCKYGNNLIYSIDDSLANWVYSVGSWGKRQASDVIGSGHTACSSVFVNWDAGVTAADTKQDNNNPTLKSSSPALNKGSITGISTYYVTGSYGTADVLNKDLGAYTSDGTGNKHMPTTVPTSK